MRSGMRELALVKWTSSSRISKITKRSQKSPIAEIQILKPPKQDHQEDELTKDTATIDNESRLDPNQDKQTNDQPQQQQS